MPINNRTIPSLSSLILFEASSRLGTFSAAANELCVTPTAVSKQIKQLELFLNTTLFVRKRTGLELTPKGEKYFVTVSETLALLAEESQKMNDQITPLPLKLDIGTCFSHFWLIPHLDDFREKYPDITLNININNERCISDEIKADYDVAFYYDAINRSDEISTEQNPFTLFRERMLLVCSPAFLEKRPDSRNLKMLWQQPLLGLKNVPESWGGWQSWALLYGIDYQMPSNEIQMEDQVGVIHAALNGAGIALAWDWHVESLLVDGQLVALTTPVQSDSHAFFITQSDKANQYSAESFINWVKYLVSQN